MIGALITIVMRGRRFLWRQRGLDRRRFVALSALIAAIEIGLLIGLLAIVGVLIAVGAIATAAALVVLTGWLAVPHWLVEHVTIPRGWHRATHRLARTDPRGDDDGWAHLCAARAVARAGSPSAAVDWLTALLPTRADAVTVVVHALVAHGRGDRDGARALLASVLDLAQDRAHARSVASEWLAADAAERGAWDELAADAARWPATPLRYLLEGVAARRHGDRPSRFALAARWLAAPGRRVTWRHLRADHGVAVTAPSPPTTAEVATAPAPGDDPLAQARTAHHLALRRRDHAAVGAAIAAWARVIDDPAWVGERTARAIALGVEPSQAPAAVAATRDALIAQLADLAVVTRAPVAVDASGLAGAVAHRVRNRVLDGLELTFERVRSRVAAGQTLAAIDEWREFLAVRAAYETALGPSGVELERVAFPHADTACGAWAVWLWNARGEHLLSHAITSWLAERALRVGDAAAIEHHGRNRALAIPRS